MSEPYDSTADTLKHIGMVRVCLTTMIDSLRIRAITHDASKLVAPEKSVFDVVTPRLRGLTYGSPEYKASLEEMGEALKHHYAENRHHPEHFQNGMHGMTLVDLVEMFCDWCAATLRHADGDIEKSIMLNAERQHFDSLLADIMRNTAREYDLGRRNNVEVRACVPSR